MLTTKRQMLKLKAF